MASPVATLASSFRFYGDCSVAVIIIHSKRMLHSILNGKSANTIQQTIIGKTVNYAVSTNCTANFKPANSNRNKIALAEIFAAA